MAATRDTSVIELLSDGDEASTGAHGTADAFNTLLVDAPDDDAAHDKVDGGGVDVVRFATSKVAVVVGLHEFGDPVEEFLEALLSVYPLLYLYQDHEELLERDADKLQLRIVSKDAELDALVAKTGAGVAPRLREILSWTSDRNAPPARLAKAQQLLRNVDSLLNDPKTKRRLGADDIEDARRMLKQKIHHSVGVRNENLALASYEKQHGCAVRLTNEHFYFLVFPRPPTVAALPTTASSISAGEASTNVDTFAMLDRKIQRFEVPKWSKRSDFEDDDDESDESGTSWRLPSGYFSICGMVDGVTDVVTISDDDDWALTPIVVEVKNRMRAFRDPPPLHDQIQMAVYMKMLDLEHGDLVQCLNTDRASIKVSRISLNAYPLSCSASSNSAGTSGSRDLWTSVILPRLYQFTRAVHRVRHNELLRLAFLNGSPSERLEILRRECSYL